MTMEFRHKVILFRVDKSYDLKQYLPKILNKNCIDTLLYECTRAAWNMAKVRKGWEKAEYAFAVFYNKVCGVYKIDEWRKWDSTLAEEFKIREFSKEETNKFESSKERCYFIGSRASSDIWDMYIKQDVEEKMGERQNPVSYFP